jgi:hypothetical protein
MAAAEHHGAMRQNEMLRLTLGLLLTAPQGIEVNYTFGGEGNVDGTPCNIVNAEFAGSNYKIYLSQSTSLPVMMTFTGFPEPTIVTFTHKVPAPGETADSPKDNMMFKRIGPAEAASTEYSVRFSDYRSVNGVQLPFTWTQTAGGAADETFSVTAYEINPANIADKFKEQQHVMIRTKKPDGQ